MSFTQSWSGSNLGYHADVYYSNLEPRPPGAQFSREWGIGERFAGLGSVGDWVEYSRANVIGEIERRAGSPDLEAARKASESIAKAFHALRADVISIISIAIEEQNDSFLISLRDKIEKIEISGFAKLARAMLPSGQIMTRDSLALSQGVKIAPHQQVIANATTINQPSDCAKELSLIARQAGSHLLRRKQKNKKADLIGTNVFIGHGRNLIWHQLKDFIQDRLKVPVDEFNRVPVSGITNITRLSEMLDASAFAFLIMTAEDDQPDGRYHARMNVIHEVGLFQGRLGFSRAIVLLEEGCEEFTNIQGLGQIRFPKGKISAAFDDVRQVLEREGVLA